MDEADISDILQQNYLNQKIIFLQQELNKNKAKGAKSFYCEDCDNKIPQKRIEAMPNTTRCISCQQQFEKG